MRALWGVLCALLGMGLVACGEKRVDHTTTVTKTVKEPGVTAPAPPPKVIHVPPPDGNLSATTCSGIKLGTDWKDVVHQYGWPDDPDAFANIKWSTGAPDVLPYPIRDTDNKRHCNLFISYEQEKDNGDKNKKFGEVSGKQLELP